MTTNDLDAAHAALRAAMAALRKHGFPHVQEFAPEVYEVLRIDPATPTPAARQQIRRKLIVAAEQYLDADQRTVFLLVAGLSLHGAPRLAEARLAQASEGLERRPHTRTVRSHFDKAAELVISALLSDVDRPVLDVTDYAYVRSRTRFDLRDETPYLVMERTISTRSEDIGHVDDRIDLPHYAGEELRIRALEGCRVEHARKVGPGVWAVRLVFPRRLSTGDQHSFATSIQLPDQDALAPIAGFLPHTPSQNAVLELRFGDRRPAVLERFVAPPRVDFDTHLSDVERISPVQARHDFAFPQMRPGLCHGVRWLWHDPDVKDS